MAKRTNIHERIHVSCVLENQLFSSIFVDYISNLSKLRYNTADIQWIMIDYHGKMLFL